MALEYSDTVGRIHPKAKALGLSAPELVRKKKTTTT